MAKKDKFLVKLASSDVKSGIFYIRKRNPKKNPNKLSFKKYDKVVRRHVIFNEEKL